MLLFPAFLAFATGSRPSLDEYLREHRAADMALVGGHAAEAWSDFTRCLELSPRNATVAYGLACAAARSGKAEDAFEWLGTAAEWGYADAVWHRAILEKGELLNAPSGHFTCDFDDMSGLQVWAPGLSVEDLPLLTDHAERLFDPKRVRAARAGVELAPVAF